MLTIAHCRERCSEQPIALMLPLNRLLNAPQFALLVAITAFVGAVTLIFLVRRLRQV